MNKIDIFTGFIKKEFPAEAERVIPLFQHYHECLCTVNNQINLISRKMPQDEYWTIHYLDSLLAAKHLDFRGKKVLDFGTGGGIPGVPLSLLYPETKFELLDSVRKKLYAVAEICDALQIEGVTMTHARLEEYAPNRKNCYDIITCRSVKITPLFKDHLLTMLKPGGTLCLYKGVDLEDVKQFKKAKHIDISHPELGTRTLVLVRK